MTSASKRNETIASAATTVLTTPHVDELGLKRIANRAGLSISLLPNGAIFASSMTRRLARS